MVEESFLAQQEGGKDALFCMRSGLRGGVKPPAAPGSWHCYTCNFGGCWPSRNTCFRCLALPGASPPAGNRRQQRETQALDRAPQRSPAVEPTHRRASTSGPPPEPATPRVVPLRLPGAGGTDAQPVLKTLCGPGLSADLLGQVAKSPQLLAKKVSSRQRQMARLKEQLHHLRGRIVQQSEPGRKHSEQSQPMLDKLVGLKQEDSVKEAQYRELCAKKLTPSSSPARSPLVSAPRSPVVSVVDQEDLQTSDDNGGDDAGMDLDHGLDGGLTPLARPAGTATTLV